MLSYAGTVALIVIADADRVPDLEVLRSALRLELPATAWGDGVAGSAT